MNYTSKILSIIFLLIMAPIYVSLSIPEAHATTTELVTDPNITSYDHWWPFYTIAGQGFYGETEPMEYFSNYDNGGHLEAISKIDSDGWYMWLYNGYKNPLGLNEHCDAVLFQGTLPHSTISLGSWTDFWIPYPCPKNKLILTFTQENIFPTEPQGTGVPHNPSKVPVPFVSVGIDIFFDLEPDEPSLIGTWFDYSDPNPQSPVSVLPMDIFPIHWFVDTLDWQWHQSRKICGLYDPYVGFGAYDKDIHFTKVIDILEYDDGERTYTVDIGPYFNWQVQDILTRYEIPYLLGYTPEGAWIKGVSLTAETVASEYKGRIKYIQLTWYDPPQTYSLTVQSSPFSGIAFWLDEQLKGCTPKTIDVIEGSRQIMCPMYTENGDKYYRFEHWLVDGDTKEHNPYTFQPETLTNLTITCVYEYLGTHERFEGKRGSPSSRIRFEAWSPWGVHFPDYAIMRDINESYADKYLRIMLNTELNNSQGTICFDIFTECGIIDLDICDIKSLDMNLGQLWTDCGRNQYFNPFSYKVDDITLNANIYNVSHTDVIFRDVPNVLNVKKISECGTLEIELEKGKDWEYKNGDLYLHLTFGDPDIYIDFETPTSIVYNMVLVSISLLMVSIVLVIIKKTVG